MSADYDIDLRASIEVALSTAFPSTPIAWQGVDFVPPDSLWLRPMVVVGGEMPKYFNYDEVVGAFVCEMFTPRNTGTGILYSTINTLKTTFFRQKINNLYIHTIQGVRDLEATESYLGKAIDFEFIGYSKLY